MLRIYTDDYVPKFVQGFWLWNTTEDRIQFESVDKGESRLIDKILSTNGFDFKVSIDKLEELVFRQEFQRPETSVDGDVILLEDIKNLVLFLAPSNILTKKFLKFVHTKEVDRFLKALIIYFEYYLKLAEFVLIRRDEITGPRAQLQSGTSTQMKQVLSLRLSQYRLILGREYSIIIMGFDDMAAYYHTRPITNITLSIQDQAFHEAFLAFSKQIVWIAMHRRAYEEIDSEMCRLFRTEHFKLNLKEKIKLNKNEMSLMYGKNYWRANYRTQTSPLVQELEKVSKHDLPLLWIGKRKYRGTDLRVKQIELEYIVPDGQLSLIDVTHGILGHPKNVYNTFLEISWSAVRKEGFTEEIDPYRIIRQPYLEVPDIDEDMIRKHATKLDSYYDIISSRQEPSIEVLKKWHKRDENIKLFTSGGLLIDTWKKCEEEARNTSYGRSVDEIIAEFISMMKERRKDKHKEKHEAALERQRALDI